MAKLALGTVQFGCDYGINNDRGKTPQSEVFEILEKALSVGIDTLDTASMYGESEKIIGNFIKTGRGNFNLVSKIGTIPEAEVKNSFEDSIQKLGVDSLYGYLFHSFQHYLENPGIWDVFRKLKSEGLVKKIGFSLYFPEEIEKLFKGQVKFDLVQVPYSVFDRRFEPYFALLKQKGIEVHVRSVFLQGLCFRKSEELTERFAKIEPKITKLNSMAQKNKIPKSALCLNFVVLNEFVDKVIVGVDNLTHFSEIAGSLKSLNETASILGQFEGFQEDDLDILLPFRWKKDVTV